MVYVSGKYYCTYCGKFVDPVDCDDMVKVKHNLCGHFVRVSPYRGVGYNRRRRGYPKSDGFKRDSLGRFVGGKYEV